MIRTALLSATALAISVAQLNQTAHAASGCAGGWTVFKSPNASSKGDNALAAIAAQTGSDIWAVGQYSPNTNVNASDTLALHFDGARWSIVATPNVGSLANALSGVASASSTQAWAVGYAIDEKSFFARSLIEAWDGSAWTIVDHPRPGVSDSLSAVAADAPNDVWAVGTTQNPLGTYHTLIEHFDGKAWSVVQSPNPGATGNQLYGVVAQDATHVWAVGQRVGTRSPDSALILRWNGAIGSPVSAPGDGAATTALYGVAGSTTGGLKAVGDAQDDQLGIGALADVSSDGSGWSREAVAGCAFVDNHLYGVATDPGGAAWGVGSIATSPNSTHLTLIVQKAPGGSHWAQVASPGPNPGGDNLLGGVAVVAGGTVWAVGAVDGKVAQRTLILQGCH